MPIDFKTKEDALTAIYRDLDMRLRTMLVGATREQIAGTWQGRRAKALLDQIAEQLRKIDKQSALWDNKNLPLIYRRQQEQIEKELQAAGKMLPQEARQEAANWHRLNTQALDAIASDMAKKRGEYLGLITGKDGKPMPGSVLRQADDYLRELDTIHIARGVGLGDSAYATGKALRTSAEESLRNGLKLQDLAEGIDNALGVVDSAGRQWSLQRYSQMAARTGMGRAMAEGAANKLQEWGEHVYMVSSHGTLCHLCVAKGQKIVTINGVKNIEDVNIGDYVLTHTCQWRRVTHKFDRIYRGELITLEITNNKLTVTGNHPILTERGWIPAKELLDSDKVATLEG